MLRVNTASYNQLRHCMLQAVNPNNKQLAERADKVAEMRSKVNKCFRDPMVALLCSSARSSHVPTLSSCRPAVANMCQWCMMVGAACRASARSQPGWRRSWPPTRSCGRRTPTSARLLVRVSHFWS